MQPVDFEHVLLAWLHDPPDKVLCPDDAPGRACLLASIALGREVRPDELPFATDEQFLQAGGEFPVMPLPHETSAEREAGTGVAQLQVQHPLSAGRRLLDLPGAGYMESVASGLREVVAKLPHEADARLRFYATWRLLPDIARKVSPVLGHLPADRAVADHTIWHHLDMAAALAAASGADTGGGRRTPKGIVSFSVTPVQSFISSARTTLDLWAGSYLLSRLCFEAMKPLLHALGPSSIVFPSLRGNPMLDAWLREMGVPVEIPGVEALTSACLPNTFLALAPVDRSGATPLAAECEEALRHAWRDIAEDVHEELMRKWAGRAAGWDHGWDEQIQRFWDVRSVVLPWPEDEPTVPGRWQRIVGRATRALTLSKQVRWRPLPSEESDGCRPKCTMMGTLAQMGPPVLDRAGMHAQRAFWLSIASDPRAAAVGGTRLGPRDRLSAVGLTKRLAWDASICRRLKLDRRARRFDDTATIAARSWLDAVSTAMREDGHATLDPAAIREEHGYWSGEWLHWPRPDFADDDEVCPREVWQRIQRAKQVARRIGLGAPPRYLAIVMMDGDHMGRWLRGQKTPPLQDVLRDVGGIRGGHGTGDEPAGGRKPVSPQVHAAISSALANFSLIVAPRLVKAHRGELVYSGGDDVLAFLPLGQALHCASDVQKAFRGLATGGEGRGGEAPEGFYRVDGEDLLMMGPTASMSAGIAAVHYKLDLRVALRAARRAERRAKDDGRDRAGILVMPRAGGEVLVSTSWETVGLVRALQQCFQDEPGQRPEEVRRGASDRWTFQIRRELSVLEGLGDEAETAFEKELLRLLGRSGSDPARLDQTKAAMWELWAAIREDSGGGRVAAMRRLVDMAQVASFLARGGSD